MGKILFYTLCIHNSFRNIVSSQMFLDTCIRGKPYMVYSIHWSFSKVLIVSMFTHFNVALYCATEVTALLWRLNQQL